MRALGAMVVRCLRYRLGWVLPMNVLRAELVFQHLGEPEGSTPADPIRQLFDDDVLIDAVCAAIALQKRRFEQGLLRLAQNLPQQNRLELAADLGNFFSIAELRRSRELLQREIRG